MTGLVVAFGMLVGLGAYLAVRGSLTQPVRLGDALAILDRHHLVTDRKPTASGLEGLAQRLQRGLRLPLTENQQRLLAMQGRTVGDFFTEKFVWTAAGLLLPTLWALMQWAFGRAPGLASVGVSLACGLLGYFVADARLRGGAERYRASAVDGMHTFFDLVVLERLANASAAQAAANAASISDAPLFHRISAGLERARMEQSQPWDELRRIATEWNVSELADFADVMQLEEQGAGLADILQARVRELRDAHLSRQKAEAQEASESLSLWMTLPALLLGVALVTPALLTLLGPG